MSRSEEESEESGKTTANITTDQTIHKWAGYTNEMKMTVFVYMYRVRDSFPIQ